MIISTFRKTDQKGFPNAYFYATKNNLGTNIFAKIIFLATTPIRRRLGKAKEKLVFLLLCTRLAPFGFAQFRRRLGKAKEKLVFLLLCTRLALFGFAQFRRRLGKAKEKLVFLLLCTRLALTLHQNK